MNNLRDDTWRHYSSEMLSNVGGSAHKLAITETPSTHVLMRLRNISSYYCPLSTKLLVQSLASPSRNVLSYS